MTAEESLREFMTQVDRDHYHGTFDSIDTIKLRILECLKFQEFEELSIEVKDGYVCVDGQRVLKLENITEFSNNRLLADGHLLYQLARLCKGRGILPESHLPL